MEFDSAGYRQWGRSYEVAHYRYGMLNEIVLMTYSCTVNEYHGQVIVNLSQID